MTEYRADQHFQALLPNYTVLLKDGETTATIYPIYNSSQLPPGLLAFLADEFNVEVERGDTFPFFDALDFEEFKNYWFGSFAAVMVLGADHQLDHQRQWEKECLGSFFMRSNFPGRSSHICSGAFLVNAGIRGKGIGKTLAECYLDWAPKLGYTSSVFNLVYESNVGARRIFESLNFKRIGKIKAAGILKDHNQAVDAIIYGKELVNSIEPPQGTYRFDKIKFYLETGKYPPSLDRQEKSRLRSSAAHYKLIDGKLYLRGKEVISDLTTQLQICAEYHQINHGGINKTTSAINERYHWGKIKDTVAQAIRNCPECRDPGKQTTLRKRKESNHHSNSNSDADKSIISPHITRDNDVDPHLSIPTTTDGTDDIHQQSSTTTTTSQDIEALVRASTHLERDSDLVYTSLEDPTELLADVTKYHQQQQDQQQGRQQQELQYHQQIHQHHHQQQAQQQQAQQHSNNNNKRSYRDIASSSFNDDSTNSNLHKRTNNHHNTLTQSTSQNQQTQDNQSNHHHEDIDQHLANQFQHSELDDETRRYFTTDQPDDNDTEIPVDPEVSAFDTHHNGLNLAHHHDTVDIDVQGIDGEEDDSGVPGEIEIARALIQANEEEEENSRRHQHQQQQNNNVIDNDETGDEVDDDDGLF